MRSKHTLRDAALALLLLGVATAARGTAQRGGDSLFSVVAAAGGGYAQYVAPYDPAFDINRNGAALTLRVMWHPDHLLRVGLETGWSRMYAYTLKDVQTPFGPTQTSLGLSAIPMLLVFSMPVLPRVQLFGGTGVYYMNSRTRSFGTIVDVREFSQGWMLAGAYAFPVSRGADVSLELKWLGATQFEDAVLTLQVLGSLRLLEW